MIQLRRVSGLALLAALLAPALPAQTPYAPDALTTEDYQRAERMLSQTMRPLVVGGNVSAEWMEDGTFWYRRGTQEGWRFVRVDPAEGSVEEAFDHQTMAVALGSVVDMQLDPNQLGIQALTWNDDGILVQMSGSLYQCSAEADSCRAAGEAESGPGRTYVVSPDGTKAAFTRDWNLWVLDLETGEETQYTTDGTEDWGYATNNAGWTKSDRPVVLWSPDSEKMATFRHDARGVSMMHLVSTEVGAPTHQAWRYPLPEDSVIFRIERMVVHLDGRVVRLDMPVDQHRSTICDHIVCRGQFSDVEWSPDGSTLAFVSSSRDHKEALLRVADPETGAVRDVMEERVDTYFESGVDMVNWHVLHDAGEVLWYSERSNWGHLYLYDLETGELERQLTSGDWLVHQVRDLDEERREILFTGSGREPGDPYFEYFYKLDMDSGEVTLLTPDSAHHQIDLSPDGEYFVDTYSTPVTPQAVVVRDRDGEIVAELEEADITDLVAAGWKAPIPFTTKARDAVTDLYGLMYTPTEMEPGVQYPVVNYLYPGPQSGSVGSRSFSPARRDHQAIAELGFIVIEVDAMGTPGRSKSFHDAYYGNMGDNGLPDQITTIEQLAERHDFIDVDRVGIWGHSGGGFASTAGILRYPDFYDVAVSQAGNHDNRNYEDDWAEKWQGLLEEYPDGTTNYDNQANQLVADQLQGKLLLAHGTMDSNVPPSNTLLVVDALIEANKDFDLIMMVNRGHGFAYEPYMMRRRWDYFVRHLLGAEPPPAYEFGQLRPAM